MKKYIFIIVMLFSLNMKGIETELSNSIHLSNLINKEGLIGIAVGGIIGGLIGLSLEKYAKVLDGNGQFVSHFKRDHTYF